jgi:HlyD family secretion protein
MRKKLIWISIGAVMVALLVWIFMPRAIQVETATVTRGRFERVIEEDGKTRLRERYVVSTPLAGRVARVTLKEGDALEKGALIATISPTVPAFLDARTEAEMRERVGAVEATFRRAKVGVERAKASLDQANNELKRSEMLAEKGFVSPTQNETARLNARLRERELESSKQDEDAALHELQQAQTALRQYARPLSTNQNRVWEIKAPISGKVLKVVQQSEDVLQAGTPLIELGDPTNLEVVVDILTSDAAPIATGMPVQISMGNGGGQGAVTMQGRVRLIEPAAFTKVSALGVEEQRVNTIIELTEQTQKSSSIGDGFRVDVRILVQAIEGATKVPVSALYPVANRSGVFVFEGGRARQKLVDIAARSGAEASVAQGLEPGAEVIVYPPTTLKDGARVAARK